MKCLGILVTLCLSSLACPVGYVRAQGSADCLAAVRMVNRSINTVLASGKACYIKYTVKSTGMADKQLRTATVPVEIVMSKYRLQMITPRIETYQDTTTVVTIIPDSKTIYITQNDGARATDKRFNRQFELQDSMFSNCKAEECRQLGNGDRQVRLLLAKELQSRYQTERITIVLNPEKQVLRRLTMDYIPGFRLRQIEYTFLQMIPEYAGSWLNGSPLDHIYQSAGRLKAVYAGYRIIDARSK